MEEQSNEALWYVVHTYSGYENKVANDLQTMVENRHLQDLICDIKVPVEMVPEIDKNGKQKMVEHKLFPGYVLVKMVVASEVAHGFHHHYSPEFYGERFSGPPHPYFKPGVDTPRDVGNRQCFFRYKVSWI